MKKSKVLQLFVVFALMMFSLLAVPQLFNGLVSANDAVCPDTGGDWVKVEGLSDTSYTYNAPSGKLIVETCYKAGNAAPVYDTIDPPKSSVTVESEIDNPTGNNKLNLSHASFRLVDEPKESTPSPTPTFTPTPTTTSTPVPSPTPTFTPTPTEEEKEGPDPLDLEGECLGVVEVAVTASTAQIKWTVTNTNDFSISFNWTANNGQNGSGNVAANSTTTFDTDGDGNVVTLSYNLEQEPLETEEEVEVCEEKQDPTPTPTEEAKEEPTPQPTPVDPAAGGMGPSISPALLPLLIGATGFGLFTALFIKARKTIKN